MFRFTIRDLLWLMVVVGLACLTINWGRQRMLAEAKLKVLNAQTAEQREQIHDLKERELGLIRAVEQKYGDKIEEWKVWPDPADPSQWKAELESQR